MNYLEYFHFDNHPFPTDGNCNYFYPRRKITSLIENISNFCRFYAGIYLITGHEGCGKSTFLHILSQKLSNNDFVIDVHTTNSTDLLKTIAVSLNIKNYRNIDDIFDSLHSLYTHGQNIIIIIDDAQNLSKEQLITLNSILDAASYIRVVLCGNQKTKKILSQRVISTIRKKIIKKYKIKYLSYLEGVRYITYITNKSLALSEYVYPISIPAILLLSFISNRNINNINIVTTSALKLAFSENSPKVKISHVLKIIRSNFNLVRNNIYLKFQKIFLGILCLLTIFFAVKIVSNHYETITTLEARQSIARQEAELNLNK